MSEKRPTKEDHPYKNASRISKMFFWWLRGLFTNSSSPIEHDNIFENLDQHKTENIYKKYKNALNSSKGGWRSHQSVLTIFCRIEGFWSISLGVLYALVDTIVSLMQSFFLGNLLLLLKSSNESISSEAYYYMIGIAVCSFLSVIILHPFMLFILETGMKIRIGCYALIYHKLFTLRNSGKNNLCGQVLNLMSNDIERFSSALSSLHSLWKGPLQIIILGYFIFDAMGYYGLVGILFILGFVPFNFVFSKKTAGYRLEASKQTDIRMRLTNEIVTKIKTIKMLVLESYFFKFVRQARLDELKAIKGSLTIFALLLSFWSISKISFYLSFMVYVFYGNLITVGKFYMLMSLFSSLGKSVVYEWPISVIRISEAAVSLRRVNEFLFSDPNANKPDMGILNNNNNSNNNNNNEDSSKKRKSGESRRNSISSRRNFSRRLSISIENNIINGTEIFIQNTTARYPDDEGMKAPAIRSISLDVKTGKLYGVVGTIGSGKSSLMNLILEELQIVSGNFYVNKELSYAAQQPWLFPGSIRDNIVFVEEFNEERYKTVLSVCGLDVDLKLWAHGDQTLIRNDGGNLSGGQKARINLARAVYKEVKLYLLDDIFSALDPDVSKLVFQKCIKEFLKNKTVILVTHNQNFLNSMDYVINMESGNVNISALDKIEKTSDTDTGNDSDSSQHVLDNTIKRYSSRQELNRETTNYGSIGFSVYFRYFSAVGSALLVFSVLIMQVLSQVTVSAIELFLAHWMNWEKREADRVQNFTSLNFTEISPEPAILMERQNKLEIFAVAIAGLVVIVTSADISFFYMCMQAAKNLYFKLYNGVTNTFLSFFTDNPSGRILNRFSKDIGSVDYQLPETFYDSLRFILECTGNIILINTVNYWLLIPTVLMGLFLVFIRYVYIRSSRNIKRLEASTRSPVFSHIKSVIDGLTTIRAFKAERLLFTDQFCKLQDINTCSFFLYISTKRAFAFWIDILCVLYIAVVMFSLIILGDKTLEAGSIGLAISAATKLIHLCQWGIKQTARLENQMISVERVLEYANLPSEFDDDEDLIVKPAENWPEQGLIEFKDLEMRYSEDEPLVLKNINLAIEPTEKIGIVGRTGAGKSSFISALFRLTPTLNGEILIDHLNIGRLNLKDLRSKISIIPQEPVFFSGTIRSNLDPFNKHDDDTIWNALIQIEMKAIVQNLNKGLDTEVADSGTTFSAGQKQLLCLARAFIEKNKIIVLDEATASVDFQTDQLMQNCIRNTFKDCTVLTIAHRIDTIIDYDRVVVIDVGEIVKCGPPKEILGTIEL